MSERRIETPRGVIVQSGNCRARLTWNPRFAPETNARYDDAQKFLDSEILRHCDPYTPMRTGMLKKSGILGTVIGSGEVIWIAPYAKKQYYRPGRIGSVTGALRGPQWFERMKTDHGKQLIAATKRIAGGRQR